MLFLSTYIAALTRMSSWFPTMLLEMVLPRCLTLFTQGSLVPQSSKLGSSLGFLRNAISLVLHLSGLGSVEKVKLWLAAYSSHVWSMSCRALREGATVAKDAVVVAKDPTPCPPPLQSGKHFLTCNDQANTCLIHFYKSY